MNQTNNIYQKLQLIQSNIGQLTKTEENKFQKYKYVSECEVLKVLRPLLKEQNLTLTFSDEVGKKEVDGQLIVETNNSTDLLYEKQEKEWVVKYLKKMVLTNSENPTEQLIYHFWATAQNTDIAKAKGSAETYAIKYFLQKFFLILTKDETDPDSK